MLWYDGQLVEGNVLFDLSDRGLLLGDGVFDTAFAIDGRVAFEDAHVARLVSAATTLGFSIEPHQVRQAMRAVAVTARCAALRTTVTRGGGPRGVAPPKDPRPLVFASSAPMRPGLAFAPMRLLPSPIRRNETSPASRLKNLGYLDAVLAAREAQQAGFDDALFLNTKGRVACAGAANLFAVVEGKLVTPSLDEGVLAGIVRGVLIERVSGLGLSITERPLPLAELERAEAVFATNSLRLLSPVTAIGDHILPSAGNATVARLTGCLHHAVTRSCDADLDTLP